MKIGFLGLLGLLFIGLKLGNIINWSWWLVLLPLYAVPAVVIVGFVIVFFIALLFSVLVGRK